MNTATTTPLAAFAAALWAPEPTVPAALAPGHGGVDNLQRIAVHRNNVMRSLVDVLAERHPVLRQLVGGDCFEALAREHVRAAPPRSPVMAHYGDGLADWLDGFAPLAAWPWLADVARLESARVAALVAADARVLSAPDFATRAADPAVLVDATLRLHPSLQVLRLRHAAVSLWQAHQLDDDARDAALATIDPLQPESALVLRDADDTVQLLPLPGGDARLVAALAAGRPLGEAADGDAATLAGVLALLLHHGALVDLDGAGPPRPGSP